MTGARGSGCASPLSGRCLESGLDLGRIIVGALIDNNNEIVTRDVPPAEGVECPCKRVTQGSPAKSIDGDLIGVVVQATQANTAERRRGRLTRKFVGVGVIGYRAVESTSAKPIDG